MHYCYYRCDFDDLSLLMQSSNLFWILIAVSFLIGFLIIHHEIGAE